MKKLKYLIMIILIFFIGIIPNISYGITKADTNAHSWGLQYPGQGFWINDSYDQFKTYFSGSGVSPDFFLNPSTRPDLYHGARPGSCTQCTEWYNQGKGFFQNIYNNAEHKIYSGSIPFVRSILEGPIDTSASSENIRRTDDLLTHMYCIEHSGGIAGEFWQIYQNVAYIHIDGNILKQASTLTKGDLYPNTYNSFNGILAYIGYATPQNGFTGNNEYGNKNYGGFGFIYSTNGTIIRSYTESQRTIWPHMNNWYREVGSKYGINFPDSANDEFGSFITEDQNRLYGKAFKYAGDVGWLTTETPVTGTDKTNKGNITISNYNVGTEQWIKIGPINWEFDGTMESITVTGNDDIKVENVKIYNSLNSTTEISASQIKSGSNFYIGIKADNNLNTITKIEGNIYLKDILTADVWFFKGDASNLSLGTLLARPEYAGFEKSKLLQKIILIKTNSVRKYATVSTENIPLTIDFSIVKIDANNNSIKLPNVGFKIYNSSIGKYLYKNSNGVIQYVNESQAGTFTTDDNGTIKLENVLVGTYEITETKNPNHGYVVKEGTTIETPANGDVITITNEQKYIKLSGMVWEDRPGTGKETTRNDLYKLNSDDSTDVLMQGVKVRLKDRRTGDLVDDTIPGISQRVDAETETNSNGQYEFDFVSMSNLSNYYIEFEYDGLIYENVEPHLENIEKGSKAAEPGRQAFNNRFTVMEKGNGETQVEANNGESNNPKVNYRTDTSNSGEYGRTLEMTSTENTEIISTTTQAGYNLQYTPGSETTAITNINLGLYKRAQTDLALQTELEEIKAEINGYGHIYRYGPKYNTSNVQEVENSWNLGIRYENEYKGTYERPIYKADAAYEYENDENSSKNLRLSLTYKITVRNEGSVCGKVNEIVAYFDSRYDKITAIGTGMDNEGNVTGTLQRMPQSQDLGNGYRRVEIDTSELLEVIDYTGAPSSGQNVTQQSIYIQFNLPRKIVLDMLNRQEVDNTLSFTSEIGSYTSYDNQGNLYAAYDLDSVPDNAHVGETETYEDDTDRASEVAITLAEARTISGYVFEDTKEESEENVAEGDGKKQDDETNLKGVTVELIDVSDDEENVAQVYDSEENKWSGANYQVDESDGRYLIEGFIPGRYLVRFTWGDGTERIIKPENAEDITIENFKSTIINNEIYKNYSDLKDSEKERFYKYESIVNGFSLAVDDQTVRTEIDNYLKEYKYNTDIPEELTTIPANTWTMEFPIEYDSDELISATLEATNAKNDTNTDGKENGHKITFPVSDINFGIIRRPEQNIELTKRVSHFKFTLPTGQVLIDAEIEEDGTVRGATNYFAYPPIDDRVKRENIAVRVEMDENLIQGSTVQITYELKVRNTSEADYTSEGYYNYGEKYYTEIAIDEETSKKSDIVKFTSTSIIDYISENSQLDVESNTDNAWTTIPVDNEYISPDVQKVLKGTELDEKYQLYKSTPLKTELIPEFCVKGTKVKDSGNAVYTHIVEGEPINTKDGANYQNQAEVIEIVKTGGGRITSTPGNYVPNKEKQETDDSTSELISISPSTGKNRNYVLPVLIIIVVLTTLEIIIYLIRKRFTRSKT